MKIEIKMVDVAAQAWALGMGHLIPDGRRHDYRLEATTPTGGSVTFHRGATADDVVAYWEFEKWETS